MKRVFRSIAICFALAVSTLPARAIVDLNGDGLDDIWALKYNAAGLDPNGDADGDGISNRDECVMGTNPFKPDSVVKINAVALDANGVHLTFPTAQGKRYQVQNNATLAAAGWANVGSPIAGTNADYLATISAPNAAQFFYRVLVSDIDTDGDGVSDWDEIQLGFDPNNTHSHGLNGVDDLTAVTQGLQAANVVSIVASVNAVTEPPTNDVSTSTGLLTVTRSGGLGPITVHYSVSGSATPGSDYTALSGVVTLGLGVNSNTITVVPLADNVVESPESVIVTLNTSAGYTLGFPSVAAVIINDYTTANGTGLMGQFWEEGSTVLSQTVLPTFSGTTTTPVLYAGLNDTTAYWAASTNHPAGLSNDGYWSSRWTGEVLPAYTQVYTFALETNFAGRLFVGGQLVVNNWPPNTVVKSSPGSSASGGSGVQVTGTIQLQAGVRYPVVIEHYQDAGSGRCYLYWTSANQPMEFVPATRLFPNPAPQILSGTDVVLLKGSGVFTYQIVASANPTGYGAANLPAGWTFNSMTGVISGSPTQAGVWQIPITATNTVGSGSAILTLTVIDTGGAITRDVWTGTYANVAALPLSTAPTSTSLVTALEGPQAPGGGDYGSRLRGFITAPSTGNYQFWLAANDNAELWIADDDEPINLFLRCATTGPTGYRDWANARAGQSPLLYLQEGQRYYVEVRHVDAGADGHVSVGWLRPGQTGTAPSEVVPGYALSPWVQPTGQTDDGTLYIANLVPQGTAQTIASGISTLRLSSDQTEAALTVDYSNLSSPFMAMHVHDDMIPNPGGLDNVVCDLEQPGDATKKPDGSFIWVIQPRSGYTAADLVQHLITGHLYFNVHTINYPGGEIKNFYHVLAGAQTFTAPALKTFTDANSAADTSSHLNANGAARFLTQATFGATSAEIARVQSLGFEGWIDDELNTSTHPITHHRDYVEANRNITNPNSPAYYTDLTTNSWWMNSITANDQLRQRVAFALSEITVVSSAGPLEDISNGLTYFYDRLLDKSDGNFKDLLEAVTLTPAMGIYLDMRKNDKPNLGTGLHANENYAREIQQLFSIGLYRMWPDGSLMLNSKGAPIPTYDQDVITGFANAFTGWNYNQPNNGSFFPTNFSPSADYINPMKQVPSHHFTGPKRILNNVVLPGLPTLPSLGNVVLNPYATHTSAQIQTPEYQALPQVELDATHAALFNHPNCGPFICRQLIQRLVTSTPSPGYLYRVVQAFNGERNVHGVATGVRGDMKEVVKAILLDYEARSSDLLTQQGYGKQREPVLRVTGPARAFAPTSSLPGTYAQDGGVITVTTSAAHGLISGSGVSLSFSGAVPQSTSGVYAVSGAFPLTATTFPVRTMDCIRSLYTQTGNTVTVISGNNGSVNHGLITGDSAYLRFRDGAGKPADGLFVVSVTDATHFNVTVPTSATIATAANCDIAFLRGEYVQSGTTVTFTCQTVHALTNTASVAVTFDATTGQASSPAAGTYPVTVTDATHFTITVADSVARSGTFNAASTALVIDRSGSAATGYQSWLVGGTDTDIGETPQRSPTVFNFYVPDFQFPGTVSDAGLYTPEFQLTSDTNVIRQANYLFGGIFSSSSSTTAGSLAGVTSFKAGDGRIAMDFSPWMLNGPGGLPWTNDANLSALIDQLSTLLLGGQLPAAAKTRIQNYALTFPPTLPIAGITVSNPCDVRVTGHGLTTGDTVTISGVTGGTFSPAINGTFTATVTSTSHFTIPVNCTKTTGLVLTNATMRGSVDNPANVRDRIRAIVHLIVTSPDFTIQK